MHAAQIKGQLLTREDKLGWLTLFCPQDQISGLPSSPTRDSPGCSARGSCTSSIQYPGCQNCNADLAPAAQHHTLCYSIRVVCPTHLGKLADCTVSLAHLCTPGLHLSLAWMLNVSVFSLHYPSPLLCPLNPRLFNKVMAEEAPKSQ